MYYDNQILPLDYEGNFLLAVCFHRHKIGGECTRESSHAFFAVGNVESPSNLNDITALCCADLPPNKRLAKQWRQVAKVQRGINRPAEAWQYDYQAEKALAPARQVPRLVLSTRNGLVYLGMDAELEDIDAGVATYVRRVIDIGSRTIVLEDREQEPVKANPQTFPKAVSDDGKHLVSIHVTAGNKLVPAVFDLSSFDCLTRFRNIYPVSNFVFQNDCWIAIEEDYLHKFAKVSGDELERFKMPKNVFGWTAATAHNSSLISFCGDKGLISIVNSNTGKVTNYYPHRGCKRDEFATAKLSDDGRWMVSRIHSRDDLVATDLNRGESWKVADLQDRLITEQEEGDWRSTSSIPAGFNFIGKRLLVSDSLEVREVDLETPASNSEVVVSEQGRSGARIPKKIKSGDNFTNLLADSELTGQTEAIKDFYYPACYIKSEKPNKIDWRVPSTNDASLLGESRLGGWPDLPEDLNWPGWNGRPMSFIAQINLAEVAEVQPDIRLPKSGILLFFIGCSAETYQRDPFEREMYFADLLPPEANADPENAVKVVFAEPETKLVRTTYDGPILPELYTPCKTKLVKGGVPLPHEFASAYECMSFNDQELENYNDLLDSLMTEDYEHQISGYPIVLQSSPLEWGPENTAMGRDHYFIPQNKIDLDSFNQSASQWGLLLQLTSDDHPDYMWGDAGHFYIYSHRENMEKGDFSRCYANFEN